MKKVSLFVALFLFVSTHAFASSFLVEYGKSKINQLDTKIWQDSSYDQQIKLAIAAEEIPKNQFEFDDKLQGIQKELEDKIDLKKQLAKAASYQAVEENWQGNLEYTVLNRVDAKTFALFNEELQRLLQDQLIYQGQFSIKGEIFSLFKLANYANIFIREDNQQIYVNFSFNKTRNRNTRSHK